MSLWGTICGAAGAAYDSLCERWPWVVTAFALALLLGWYVYSGGAEP